MWSVAGGVHFYPCDKVEEQLPPGQYIIENSDTKGIFFTHKEVCLDSLLILPDDTSEKIIKGIELFWTRESRFRERGFLWKRGILLYGPPGSGKTSTVQILSKKIQELGGLSIYCTYPVVDARGLEILRRIEPDRPIIYILEDLDAIIEKYGESEVLALLDGELQIDNVVFVATTNYPEELDDRIKNRPSRFDEVIPIGMPSESARGIYLSHVSKALRDDEELRNKWVKDTKNFSIAHLKELVVSVEVLDVEYNSALKRLKTMMTQNVSSDDFDKNKAGFTSLT
jgi:SpoVK/Ycf46/Vps4 family AAA+-type ATPase